MVSSRTLSRGKSLAVTQLSALRGRPHIPGLSRRIARTVYTLYTTPAPVKLQILPLPEMKASPRLTRGFERGERVVIRVGGKPVEAFRGETISTALMTAGIWRFRSSPRDGTPRGPFCLMGVCQECAIRVDGKLQQACLVPVHDGLTLELEGAP